MMRHPGWTILLTALAGWMNRQQLEVIDYLRQENRTLKQLVGSRRLQLTDLQRRRLAARGCRLGWGMLSEVCSIVTPATLFRWHRTLIARKYDGSKQRQVGRPGTMPVIRSLIVRFAQENRQWGYSRIQGALSNLGHQVSRSTVLRTLRESGLEPAPERGRTTSWSQFLRSHFGHIAAADLFTVEVWTLQGLVRYHVFFVIELATRRVRIVGMNPNPTGAWLEQMARALTDPVDGFLRWKRYLVHDRDPLFSRGFGRILKSSGIRSVKLPPRSPNLNAYAERFVRSIKSECVDRTIPLGEGHLRRVIEEYAAHYHQERNHQGIDNKIIEVTPVAHYGPIVCRERLGGLLNYYYREAA